MLKYIAVVHGSPEEGFGSFFPDLPACIGAGATIEELKQSAKEVGEAWLELCVEGGKPVPRPSALDDIAEQEEAVDAVAFLLIALETPNKRVRANLSIPAHELARIDQAASAKGETRSNYFLGAVRDRMNKEGVT